MIHETYIIKRLLQWNEAVDDAIDILKLFQSGEEKESIYSTVSWRNGESQLSKLMNACVRYVSLIPTYDVTETHSVTLMGVVCISKLEKEMNLRMWF